MTSVNYILVTGQASPILQYLKENKINILEEWQKYILIGECGAT